MPKTFKTIDRPLKDIIDSMARVFLKPAENENQAQFQRDLEKLCAAARTSKSFEDETNAQG